MAPSSTGGGTAVTIRLTEPHVLLVGGPEHERARARRRRALRQTTTAQEATAPTTTDVQQGATPLTSPAPSRPGSRPGSRTASPAPTPGRGRLPAGVAAGEFVPPNSRGRSGSRNRNLGGSRGRSSSRAPAVGPDDPPTLTTGSGTADEALLADEPPPAMLRGLLTLTLAKPSRIREISVRLRGIARTEWPEGIGPRRMDTMEESILTNITSTFFTASGSSMERRAASIGPGSGDHAFDPRSDSRGRSARRATSMMPSRDTSHGRSYPSRDSAFHEDDSLANVAEEPSFQVPLHTLSRISSSTELEQMNLDHPIPPVRPGETAPAYEAVPSAPSSPSLAPSRPPLNGRARSGDSFDLTRSLRNPALQGPQHIDGSPTPSRSPLGRSSPRTAPSSPATNGDVPLAPLSRSTTGHSRLSQESNPSSEAADSPVQTDSPAQTDSRDISTASSIASRQSTDDSENGWNSAPVLGSNFERGRPATRDNSRGSGGEGSIGASTSNLPIDGSAPTFQSRASNRQSPSPAGFSTSTDSRPSNRSGSLSTTTGNRRRGSASSTATAGPPPTTLPTALRNMSASGSRSSTSKSRFSLAGLSDALRGKSSSRARESSSARGESSSRPSRELSVPASDSRRATSPDTRRPNVRDQSRGRKTALKALRDALTSGKEHGGVEHDSDEDGDLHATGWKEFRAGTYTYPISIAVPASLPPTIASDFGHVSYSLKATVYRAGALTPNLSTSTEIILVSAPGQDDTEENESIVVERFWETQMKYHVALSGKSFPIGGTIPISIRLNPMAKVKLYRVTAILEQKTNYYASGRKLTRHETPKKYPLLRIEHKDPKDPLLPILSDDPNAIADHPLAAFFINPTSSEDATPSLLDPLGPWNIESYLKLPECTTKVNFSTNHDKANISVSHILKVMLRVERGDDDFLDSKGKRKLWDVIIESPIHILSCRCTANILPAYSPSGTLPGTSSLSLAGPSECSHNVGLPSHSSSRLGVSMHMSVGSSRNAHSLSGAGAGAGGHRDPPVATLAQNLLFARLVAGEETPSGEVPPTYDAAIHAPLSTGRRTSRSGSRGASRSASGSRRRRSDVSTGTVTEFRQRLGDQLEEEEEHAEGFEADADEDDDEREERGRGRSSSRNVSR
ncbi:or S-antigen, C-terminal domain-domain-containing protein [Leucosporidium creatinivorum]|uniref:Or S-antigen, C-terminal domain-domain-containing protein n=1 Tax=Leucosporidium creatinivorum TaxID=106004 RepID=A0A1Y2EH66_9BASI|nr:or S-antigen, C-terminal domain-domain-containing protein [Leucosporidium creatinivorum]